MTLLQKRDSARLQRRLSVLEETRRRLRLALHELVPGERVIVFGSLAKPGIFNDCSDIDLALETEPPGISLERFISELMERLERRVDVLILGRCHFRDKILREGELWTA